jgi:hypothetical protein
MTRGQLVVQYIKCMMKVMEGYVEVAPGVYEKPRA